jgi:RNA polymerase sigma factor (sigma-70 family)
VTTAVKQMGATVFVVDDDPAVREYLRWLIESVGLTVQTHPTAQEFLDVYNPSAPGCLVLDVRMPGLSGFDLQAELVARQINIPIIMMTAYAEVPMAVRAMRGGAIDFLQKPFDGQMLLDRIQQAIESDRATRRAGAERARIVTLLAGLPPRQRAVLEGLVAGKPSKVIAAELGLSPKTVDVHRARLMERLGAQSLPDLFRLILLARGEQA